MMCRMTSLCCLLVIVLLDSAVDACNGRGEWCSTHRSCCDSGDVCCITPVGPICTRGCSGRIIPQRRGAQLRHFFRR
nr:conopeptide [Conus arenatus]